MRNFGFLLMRGKLTCYCESQIPRTTSYQTQENGYETGRNYETKRTLRQFNNIMKLYRARHKKYI